MENKDKEYPNTRLDWENYADFCNDEAEEKAILEFKKTPEAQCLKNADAIKAVRAGKAPYKISDFASNELKRVLSTKTWTECLKYDVDDDLSDAAFDTTDPEAVMSSYIDDIWTDEFGVWRQIVVALAAFLREAAAFAKKAGSIDSARKFILAWGKMHTLDLELFACMSQGEAARFVASIAEAEEILWADLELATL